MTAFGKGARIPNTQTKRVNPLGNGGVFISCFEKEGRLHKGISAQKIAHAGTLPQSARQAFYSAGENSVFVDNCDIYRLQLSNNTFYSLGKTYARAPWFAECIGESGAVTLFGSGKAATEYGGGVMRSLNFPRSLYSGAYHCGRFFFCDRENRYAVFWTGLDGAEDWEYGLEGSGYIELEDRGKGEILRVVPCGSSLVLVRRRGLNVMAALGNPENFRIGSAAFDTGAIEENSVAADGAAVYFATDKGVFSFNGSAVTALSQPVFSSPRSACACDKKYFVAAYCLSVRKNAVYCFDLCQNAAYVIDLPANALCAGGEVYAFTDDGVYRLAYPHPSECRWISRPVDFGTEREKRLRYILINGSSVGGAAAAAEAGSAAISVSDGKSARSFNGAPVVRADMRGGRFTVCLSGDFDGAEITLVAEVLK